MDYKTLIHTLANQIIVETIATMMDVQPITAVGQINPAKQNKKKKEDKEV